MSSRGEGLNALLRRFLADEGGGAGLEYVLFAACWGAAVSGGLYVTSSMLTAKFGAISAALRGNAHLFR